MAECSLGQFKPWGCGLEPQQFYGYLLSCLGRGHTIRRSRMAITANRPYFSTDSFAVYCARFLKRYRFWLIPQRCPVCMSGNKTTVLSGLHLGRQADSSVRSASREIRRQLRMQLFFPLPACWDSASVQTTI